MMGPREESKLERISQANMGLLSRSRARAASSQIHATPLKSSRLKEASLWSRDDS